MELLQSAPFFLSSYLQGFERYLILKMHFGYDFANQLVIPNVIK